MIHELHFNQDELDITDIIKDYLASQQNNRLNNTAIFTYDVVDNVIGVKDPKGTNTVLDYNSVGK